VTDTAPAPEAEAETDDTRTARQKVIDHLTDTEGEQTVAEIIQGTGLIRNTAEQAIFRAVQSEQIERTAPGTYRLAPPKPLPSACNGHSNEEWVARIEAWQARIEAWQANPASWNIEEDGPPPNDPNHRIPLDVVGRFKDRQKREREKPAKQDAEGAAARQSAADAELRDQLIAATGGNFAPGPGIEDIAPIKVAMELVALDLILSVIRWTVSKLCCPTNAVLTSWREPRLLKALADEYCRSVIVPSLVAGWGAAKAPGKPVQRAEAPPAIQTSPSRKTHQRCHRRTLPCLPTVT
jgi:hypothetical protein